MSDWQPIATAPRDGTEFDGWGFTIPDSGLLTEIEAVFARHTECFWGKRDSHYVQRSKHADMGPIGWCSTGHDGWSWAMILTHWMPPPTAPNV